jgi:tetratricopeptide (TPR) repeat protein
MFMDEEVYERISKLSDEATALAEDGSLDAAIETFERALELVPEPKEEWELTAWVLTAIGDIAFQTGDYERADRVLSRAVLCPGALSNPFIRLRRGQTLYELGDMQKAEEELTAAYTLEGFTIFADEDPKYVALVKGK